MNRKALKLVAVMCVVVLAAVLAACGGAASEPEPTQDVGSQLGTLGVAPYVSPPPAEATPSDLPMETPSPTAFGGCPAPYSQTDLPRPRYQLYLYLGVAEHAGYVEERIVYPNTAGEALESLLLVVEPNRYESAFSLLGLELGGGQIEGYTLEVGYLRVPLPLPLPDGCTVELSLSYHLELPAQAGIFGYTDEQLVLSNWYAFFPPYAAGQGWLVHEPGAFGEYLAYPIADFAAALELVNPPQGVLVAAPAPAVMQEGRFTYTLEGARTFSLAVLSGYTVRTRQWNGIDVAVYSRWATAAAVGAALNNAIASLAFFEDLFGPYPFESLTIVQLDMYDGMESDGMFYLSKHVFSTYDGSPRNMLMYLVPHEVAHNWWFSQVANDQAMEPWLDEALCTYTELLYYREAHPDQTAWWWEYRITQWEPQGMVDASIYSNFNYEDYRQAVYLRGVEFFRALHERMGDEAFYAFLRSYLERGRYRIMTGDDFFSLLQEYPVEINDLLVEYFDSR